MNTNEIKECVMRTLSSTGSTWLTAKETKKLCNDFKITAQNLKNNHEFAYYDAKGMVTVAEIAKEEKEIAVNLMELLMNHTPQQAPESVIRSLVEKFEVEENNGYKLHYHQVDAVIMVVNNSLSILTGGPGTGKTTVLRAIAYVLRAVCKGITIAYIAPTGKASKRITESTGEYACTGHKKVGLGCGGQLKPVEERVLFSDESSMNDIWLTSAISKCLQGNRRFVVVGDVDQLPSVGAGAVLRDMIRSNVIPKTMLTHTFRQDNSSVLFKNICKVREGKDDLVRGNDFEPVLLPDGDVADVCVKKILEAFMQGVKDYGLDQTVVLLPYRRSGVCSNLLNKEIQKIVNPKGESCEYTDSDGNTTIFRVNDPVMQLENRPECVNGDVGTVIEATDKSVTVEYADGIVCYRYRELEQLTLAYAMSIHKSQGSEYKCVVMALLDSHKAMLQRNLIYTGITRAKTKCIVFYQKKALRQAVTTIAEDSRTTLLAEMLITLHTRYVIRRYSESMSQKSM